MAPLVLTWYCKATSPERNTALPETEMPVNIDLEFKLMGDTTKSSVLPPQPILEPSGRDDCQMDLGMPTGLASLVLQSQAFFTMVFAAFWLKEQWRANQLAGLVLAAGGLVLIGSAHGLSMPLAGFMLTIGAAAMWACGNIVTRAVGRYGPMNQLAFVVWASLVPPLPLLLLSAWLEGPQAMATALTHFSGTAFAALAYLAWAATLFGYGVWTALLSRYPANRIAPFSLLVPVVGLTTGWLVFGEVLKPVHFAGGALLMAGLLVNLFGARLFARLKWQAS